MAALGRQRFSRPTAPVQKGHLIRDVALAGLRPSGPGAAGSSSRTNVLIRGGVIERVGDLCTFGPVTRDADAVLEVDGRDLVALPALVEPHAHLDKALTAGTFSSGDRDLAAAIEAWVAARPSMRTPDIASRAEETALRYLANGTTVIRTHTDTGDGIGTRAIEAVLSVRAKLRGVVDLQVVAACSVPVTGAAGRTNRATFLSALDMGADVVGGAPWLDPEPSQCLDFLLSIAAERRLPVDLTSTRRAMPGPLPCRLWHNGPLGCRSR